MAVGPVDPREVLKGVEALLGKDGELRSLEGVAKVFSLMKASHKMVSRCMYLNILLQTKSHDILNRFIRVGGYKLLNSWLTYSKTTTNTPMLQLILLTLQKLPLTVDHLKQNNTAKLVKHLSKSGETEELRKLALVLVEGWMAIIRSQSVSSGASPNDKKRKKEDVKVRPEVKAVEKGTEEERKREKPKAHAPSHAKIRSTGLEVETPTPIPTKKVPVVPQLGDKYNIKPAVLKRPSSGLSDAPPVEKKYKPLNTTPNSTKEIKVKLIPAQPMESLGFLDALNSAPVPGIKIKKKKPKAVSPTSNKPCPFESKPQSYSSTQTKPSSPEAPASHTPPHEPQDLEQPGTPVPTEDPEAMDTDKPNALSEPRGEEESLTKKGKKKKSVRWAEEEQLKEYFYFDLDETERVNVNKIKDFGEAAKRELMMDRHTFEMARRLSHDAMEERVPWTPPRPLILSGCLVSPGSSSTEKLTQRDREMGILQEIFLNKESVPDSPHEPDPEPYEPMPPRLIPLDEDCTTVEDSYTETADTAASCPPPTAQEGSKLPPVLANLMVSLNSSNRSPQAPSNTPPPNNSSVNVQELLSSIMGAQGSNQSAEDLIKQPDFSDKIKQLLGSLQQNQNQNQNQQGSAPPMNAGLLGHGPGMNMNNNMNMPMPINGSYPPNKPPGGPHFGHPPPPHGHGPPPFGGGGPRMMGPPPGPQGRGGDNGNYWGDDSIRGGPHRGGHFHRGRGRGGDQGFRGRGGRGGPRGGHNNMGDMSKRPVCRHFMMKGNCRYENNCAFYHPGVNGPPLPPQHGH
ncbi:serine/threonine-protein phosphatase 1 regulatory subunit 10 [Ictalurus furcatus]|uniref:serine/threonine-protein phosphatase 1 regulatory subunit 10 n=1 Tax=Ictalurus furcatus TaxID=66913 RepID=UPI002350E522|nr:serine/threonine-protein phosphatase 1 regulatory subunit 10 [Ictalurus furcatus]XP_053494916.1 serine/threonine-protein phosphatase 1 regulatory subunit 10 [Ictalurus furcatus]XP_053494917.1 serine/threonine-protein phosphatase 1 regulatory subunit 10 [Ictalurus furcatus]XP_053494918.1 serine/threonine-protein phosphatase 1 regulatory subunit 10 [Ictalurus furcatus]XP_053494919.1 serine/threonine-protein phosphatase 1 regulatory subunit 10 [Ictalurus furcatus]